MEFYGFTNHERSGKSTVRSAYQVARGLVDNHGNGAASASSTFSGVGERFWKKLWNANVPGKLNDVNYC
ncbi:hypothetical protein DVH24_001288 [Malus domestica]|uniref:Uncharacterized protein n=1 Tax=Malus domestica TaxID=3750 RepID=A0A498K406_MALDO|nr:hypothetical protein DVH24_001288 [Malus domestica]